MIAHVALPLPIDRIFSYALSPSIAPYVKPLARVKVPFNNRSLVGFVLNLEETDGEELKVIDDLLDPVPLIDRDCFRLCEWAAAHYVAPIGLTLKYALSASVKVEKYCTVKAADPSVAHLDGMLLRKAYGVAGKEGIFDYLGRALISLTDVFTGLPVTMAIPVLPSSGQDPLVYAAGIRERLSLYLSLASSHLDSGHNVLVLLPDRHGVGEYFSRAFSAAFPKSAFWFASSMTEKKKAESYFRARNMTGQLFMGNRSSVFLPIANLGLVIIDRPEEEEYRNEEGFKFNAPRLAVKKAEMQGVSLVLGSVSPPLDIMRDVEEGRMTLDRGRPERRPPVHYMKGERGKGRDLDLPPLLVEQIRKVIDHGENVVIHSHRKSYAASLRCSACGRPLVCLHCESLSVTYNREADQLMCTSCRARFPYGETCPSCHSPYIRYYEVGAEYLQAALQALFPDTSVLRVTGEEKGRSEKDAFNKAKGMTGAIVVGTNVLSKLYGLQAGMLVLYRWDNLLRTAGYRARERMFQILENLRDAVQPEEIVAYGADEEDLDMAPFFDPPRFYQDELARRKTTEFPPYRRFFLINVLKGNVKAVQRVLETIETLLSDHHLDEQVLGPIEVKGQYGWRIILKGDDVCLSPLLRSLYRVPGVRIEADPLYF